MTVRAKSPTPLRASAKSRQAQQYSASGPLCIVFYFTRAWFPVSIWVRCIDRWNARAIIAASCGVGYLHHNSFERSRFTREIPGGSVVALVTC